MQSSYNANNGNNNAALHVDDFGLEFNPFDGLSAFRSVEFVTLY